MFFWLYPAFIRFYAKRVCICGKFLFSFLIKKELCYKKLSGVGGVPANPDTRPKLFYLLSKPSLADRIEYQLRQISTDIQHLRLEFIAF